MLLINVATIKENKMMTDKVSSESQTTSSNRVELKFYHNQDDVLQAQLEQLGPSIVDEEASSYAATLLQVVEPVGETRRRALAATDDTSFNEKVSGYFVSSDADTVQAASDQLGPSLTDEEVAAYLAKILA